METGGPWTREQVERFARASIIPARISFLGAAGEPRLVSLWFHWDDSTLWLATGHDAYLARRLAEDPRCGFEISSETPPYRGVRGSGSARLVAERGREVLDRLLERYRVDPDSELASGLRARSSDEVAIAIDVERLSSWDFGDRMRDSGCVAIPG